LFSLLKRCNVLRIRSSLERALTYDTDYDPSNQLFAIGVQTIIASHQGGHFFVVLA